MENIIKLAIKTGLPDALLVPYYHDLSSKPENVEVIADYTIQQLRAKKGNASLLFLLNAFVEKCPASVFSQHGANWVQLLIRNAADNQGNLSVILKVLTTVIHNLAINNCKKELDSKAIEKVVEFCTQLHAKGSVVESLKCLDLVLRTYPEHCSFIAKKVNVYLLQWIDQQCPDITTHVGICFVHLYQVKGGLCRGSTLEDSWMIWQNSLLANIYETMNTVLEEEALFVDPKLTKGALVVEGNQPSKSVLCQRILNLTSYLDLAMRVPLPIAKPIQATKVLVGLIYRVLEENSPFFSNKNLQRDITIGPYLHRFHRLLLELLKSTITALRGNALLFNKTICAVLKIVLKRSSRTGNHPYQCEFRSQKTIIFKLVEEWIQVARCGQDVESLVQLTLQDIWETIARFEAVVKVNQDDKSKLLTKEKGGKKRKRNPPANEIANVEFKNIADIVEACRLVNSALASLNRILFVFGHSLTANQHQTVLMNIHVFAKKLVDISMRELPLWSTEYNLFERVCQVLITFNSSSHHLHRSSINYSLSLLDMIRSCEPQNRALSLSFHNHLETVFHYPRSPIVMVNPTSVLIGEPPEVDSRRSQEIHYESDEESVQEEGPGDENEITSTSILSGPAEVKDTTPAVVPIDAEVEESSDEEEGSAVDEENTTSEEPLLQPTANEVEQPSSPKKARKISETNQASVDEIMSFFQV